MSWIGFFILLSSGYIYSYSTATVRGNSDGKCMTNLMNGLTNEAFTSSSYQDNFYPHQARVTFEKSNSTHTGLAWCPRENIGPDSPEWIQVAFDSLKMISNIFTLGRDSGNFGFFVQYYYLEYQREDNSTWYRYRNPDNTTIIAGNQDSRNSQAKQFLSNIVVRTIRIIPTSESTSKVCLKFTLYGCDFNDGTVEYTIPQGDTFVDADGQKYALVDRTYDTSLSKPNLVTGPVLYGGIGQLMDNQINTESIKSTLTENFNFIGWKRRTTLQDVQMVFRFDRVRRMKSVRFHVLNNFPDLISIFASVTFEFSIGGDMYGVRAKNIVFNHSTDTHVLKARWVKIDLSNSLAKYVRATLQFRLDWIVITEVEFDTIIENSIVPVERKSNVVRTTDSGFNIDASLDAPAKMNYLLTLFGVLIALAVLLIIIILFIIRLRRDRKRVFKGKPNASIRYGNMPCNNVIPIPVIPNNNGGFYKPVPNGAYDCILPYQSHTLNIRKVTGFLNQHNQQQFGTFNNRANGSTNTNVMNKDNYNATTLSPIVGQQSFNQNINTLFSENKPASFDGIYAGTGSNTDYSNPSVTKEPITLDNSYQTMHLMNMSPVMCGQYNTTNNSQMIGPFQVRLPYNVLYPTENQAIDPSMVIWSEVLLDIIDKHTRFDTVLQSPVGGSLIVKQCNAAGAIVSIEEYESNICDRLPPIESHQIDIQTLIGIGKYGSMYKGVYNGSAVVIKSIDRNCAASNRISLLKSISDLLKLSNKNIASMIGYCSYNNTESSNDFSDNIQQPMINCIITEHSRYIDLHTFIRMFTRLSIKAHRHSGMLHKNGSDTSSTSVDEESDEQTNSSMLSQSCLIYIASQISNGMSYLEQEELVHRDLAARNCLLGPRLSIIITDTALDNKEFADDYISINDMINNLATLGLANSGSYPNINLPLYWMSWEAVLKAEYSIKSDIWSFGVVLWEILTNCQSHPYYAVPQNSNINPEFMSTKNVKCLSLLYNFKCLAHSSDNALLPNNESLNQMRKISNWLSPLPLPIPSLLIDDNHAAMTTPRTKNVDITLWGSNSHILNSSREMRDLIESCWSIDAYTRPSFRDINRFLDQKINGFNAEEEYQNLQVGFTKS